MRNRNTTKLVGAVLIASLIISVISTAAFDAEGVTPKGVLNAAKPMLTAGTNATFAYKAESARLDELAAAEAEDVIADLAERTQGYVNSTPSATYHVVVTAYSSTVAQTDSTPFITASGTYVRDGVVAANFLPIGTKIKMPDLYGEKVFHVEDRMNSRYSDRVDMWVPDTQSAKDFGKRYTRIEVL